MDKLDPLNAPLAPETAYKHHFDLLDRYQAFSGEVLRLSLASIAGFGFFLSIEKGVGSTIADHMRSSPWPHGFIIAGLGALVLAAATALTHRYVSSDAMYYVLVGVMREQTASEKRSQHLMLKASEYAILVAPAALGLGVIGLAAAFVFAW